MQMHRDRHNNSMHAVPIQPLKFISPPKNSWNHRLLLSVTPRRANDVPRRSHLARLRLTTFMDRSHLARLRLTIRPLTPHLGTRSSVTSLTVPHGTRRYSMIHTGIQCRSHPTRAHDVHPNAIRHHNLFKQCNKHSLSQHCNKCGLSQHCVQSAFHDACHTKTHAKPMHIQHQP